eukprot:m.96192 g.96192  ORF g.96192 m.96192 type:complete len:677 (+) comp8624_c0_seq2:79-2109(+)
MGKKAAPSPGVEGACPHAKDVNAKKFSQQIPHCEWMCATCSMADARVLRICLKCCTVECEPHMEQHSEGARQHHIAGIPADMAFHCYTCKAPPTDNSALSECRRLISKSIGPLSTSSTPDTSSLGSSQYYISIVQQPTALGLRGLRNLGNTCFMNSVLQCLNRTMPLRERLSAIAARPRPPAVLMPAAEAGKPPLLPLTLDVPGRAGSLTNAFCDFLGAMQSVDATTPVSPSELLDEIGILFPRFRGGRQHDSQELLRALLDGLEREEKVRIRSVLLARYGLHGPDATLASPGYKALADDKKEEIMRYCRGITTAVDYVFGGRIASTVVCHQCNTASRTVEPFLDLSLPIVKGIKKTGSTLPRQLRKVRQALLPKVATPATAESPKMSRKKLEKLKKQQQKEMIAVKRREKRAKGRKGKGMPDAYSDSESDADGDASSEAVAEESAEPCEPADVLVRISAGLVALALQGGIADAMAEVNRSRPVSITITNTTAAPPYVPRADECSIQSCIAAFCHEETLSGDDLFACTACYRRAHPDEPANSTNTIKRPASKHLLVETQPRILTLHLKRFEQQGFALKKVSTHVSFPLVLDIAPFCYESCSVSVYGDGDTGIRYGLYGVVVHQGSIYGGHYICFVRAGAVDRDTEWYCISDTSVSKATERDVLAAEAYILFYEQLH